MALIDLQRDVLALCFRAQPPESVLAGLGNPGSWLMYREMVRERLLREIRVALPRSCKLLGEAGLARGFEHFLEYAPPRTRFFREIVRGFVESILPLMAAGGAPRSMSPAVHAAPRLDDPADLSPNLPMPAPPALADLLRYELSCWEVRDLEDYAGAPPAEFDFDRVPIVAPALRLLRVRYAIHRPPAADGGYAPGEHLLCLQRRGDAAQPQTWTLTPTTYRLLQRWQRADCSVTESVQALAREQNLRVDAAFIDGLCAALAQFLEVGIVLGSRPA